MDLNAFYKPMSEEYLFKKFKEYYRYLKKNHYTGDIDRLKFLIDCINNKRNFGDAYAVADVLFFQLCHNAASRIQAEGAASAENDRMDHLSSCQGL